MKKILKKILKWFFLWLLAFAIIMIAYFMIVRDIHKKESAMISKDSIQETTVIEVNGIKEELDICGRNTDNPIILFLHGGPGSPTGCLNYIWYPYMCKTFTMVSFDQRGCGKTYYMNPDAEVSRELILEDVDETVDYLRQRFGQQKIIIMGHSWGTLLGTLYVKEHPEKVTCYFGVGQMVNSFEDEKIGIREACDRAFAAGDTKYVIKLSKAYQGFKYSKKIDRNFMTYRKMEPKYLIGDKEKLASQLVYEALTSPQMDSSYLKWYLFDGVQIINDPDNPLTKNLFYFNAYDTMEYEVPMYFISGSEDYVTPSASVKEYCDAITAPDKRIMILDGAGHNTFVDIPIEFSNSVNELFNNKK